MTSQPPSQNPQERIAEIAEHRDWLPDHGMKPLKDDLTFLFSHIKELEAENKRLTFILNEVDLTLKSECYNLDIEYPEDLHPADVIDKHICRTYHGDVQALTEKLERAKAGLIKIDATFLAGRDPTEIEHFDNYTNGLFSTLGKYVQEVLASLRTQD